eukprot:m.210057 g.210057  ORF g.210057 m.210057 type:complete len:321 (-) comp53956_c0_seq2:94-1056(-)
MPPRTRVPEEPEPPRGDIWAAIFGGWSKSGLQRVWGAPAAPLQRVFSPAPDMLDDFTDLECRPTALRHMQRVLPQPEEPQLPKKRQYIRRKPFEPAKKQTESTTTKKQPKPMMQYSAPWTGSEESILKRIYIEVARTGFKGQELWRGVANHANLRGQRTPEECCAKYMGFRTMQRLFPGYKATGHEAEPTEQPENDDEDAGSAVDDSQPPPKHRRFDDSGAHQGRFRQGQLPGAPQYDSTAARSSVHEAADVFEEEDDEADRGLLGSSAQAQHPIGPARLAQFRVSEAHTAGSRQHPPTSATGLRPMVQDPAGWRASLFK